MYSRDLNPNAVDASTDRTPNSADTTIWEVIARPDPPATRLGFEKERLRRFGVAMEGGGKVLPVEEVLQGMSEIISIFES